MLTRHGIQPRVGLIIVAALSALAAPVLLAQDPSPPQAKPPVAITATPEVPLGRWVDIRVEAPADSPRLVRVRLISPGIDRDVTATEAHSNLVRLETGRYAFTYPGSGEYTVELVAVVADRLSVSEATFRIGQPGPLPPDPKPPIPPTPDPAPFPSEDGLRVLIIEETAQRAQLPQGMQEVLLGPKVREWLTEHTKDDGTHVGWRIWDDDFTDDQLTEISERWKQAYDAAKKAGADNLPWLIAVNGNKWFSGPLPSTPDAAIAELQKLR